MEEKPVPRVIAWESTRSCRFACVHCRANAQIEPDPLQLNTEEVYRLIDQISDFSEPVFIISGGDPLLRKDIFDVAARADEKGLKVVMSPSGSRITPRIVEKMKNSGIRMLSISCDGSNPEVHDRFRKVPGSYEMIRSSLEVLNDNGMPFQINTTVTQHNIDDLPHIRDFVRRVGGKTWDIFMLVPTGRAKIKMEISPEKYEDTIKTIYDWNHSSPIPIKMTCAPHYMRLIAQKEKEKGLNSPIKASHKVHGRLPSSRLGGRGCMAGNGFCFISNIGEVYGCGFLPLKAGNTRNQNFRDIYQESGLFTSLRDFNLLGGKCGICEYKTVCGGCRARSLGASEDYLGEEPFCTYIPKNNN
jgi:radical SAM protein with 4Fe4S-binding SPASM domain